MSRGASALLCALIALSLYNPILAGKFGSRSSGRHSYPHSHGMSGTGYVNNHNSGKHNYPASNGMSGNNQHGGRHDYPTSNGFSGTGQGHQNTGNSMGNRNPTGYANNHHSGKHEYPASNSNSGPRVTNIVNNNIHYHPPQQIHYAPHGGPSMNFPVYHGSPPSYVYMHKDSGSKFSNLLAGLALFNLGALTSSAFTRHSSGSSYTTKPGEVCLFGVKKDNGDYEETRIQCDMITSFIWADEARNVKSNNNTVEQVNLTVTNVTTINTVNTIPEIQSNLTMLPNNTLVGSNVTALNNTLVGSNETALNNTMVVNTTTTIVSTSTTTNITVDQKLKGPPVQVTPGMQCYVINKTPTKTLKKTVSCGLLDTYAHQSLRRSNPNSATRNTSTFVIYGATIISYILLNMGSF